LLTLATVGAARPRAPYLPGLRDPRAERPVRLQRFERDAMLRLLATTTDTATTRYTWDAGDRLIEARREPTAAGAALGVTPSTVAFEHDAAGRLTGERTAEHGRHGAVGYTLDELDNLVSLALPHGQRIEWLHYGSGHVHQIRAGAQVISDFERDDLHREVLRTQGCFSERRGYDALGRRTWQSVGPVSGEPLPELVDRTGAPAAQAAHPAHAPPPARPIPPPPLGPGRGQFWRTYHYSREGELAEQHDSLRGTLQYRHDPAGYLLQRAPLDPPGIAPTVLAATPLRPSAEQFAWDAAGNLLDAIARDSRDGRDSPGSPGSPGNRRGSGDPGSSDPHRSDARRSAGRVEGNRLLMWQDIRFDYDPWGNLLTKRKGSTQTQHFIFDAEDRLLTVRTTSQRGSIETHFEYDALGRRIAVTDTHTSLAGPGRREHRRFVWQGLRMVQEIRATGLSSYVYSPESPYAPLARLDALHDEALIALNEDAGAPPPRLRVRHFHTDLVGTRWSSPTSSANSTGPATTAPGARPTAASTKPPKAAWSSPCACPASTPTRQPGCTTTPSGITIRMSGGLFLRIRLGWRVGRIFTVTGLTRSAGQTLGAGLQIVSLGPVVLGMAYLAIATGTRRTQRQMKSPEENRLHLATTDQTFLRGQKAA
jgi:YD repeat-containing protein